MYDGLFTFGMRLTNVALSAVLTILTARALGPGGRGLYALPGIEAALVSSIFGGLGGATSYFLLNRKRGAAFMRTMFACAALWIVVAALALIPLSIFHARWTLLPAMAVLPGMAFLNISTGYALGVKNVRNSSTLAALPTLLTIGSVGIALFLVSRTPGVAVTAWVASTTLAGVLALSYTIADARKRLTGGDPVGFGEYARFCLKVSSVYVVTLLNYRADLYVVAMMLTPAALGMYGIVVTVAETLLLPTQAAAFVASPHIASMEIHSSRLLTARCVRNNLLLAATLCILLFVFGRPLLEVLYGKAFLPAAPAFDILLLGVLALAIGSPVSNYFTLRLGKPQISIYLGALSAGVCLGTSLSLIHHWGMSGAAVGSTAGYVIGQFAGLIYFRHESRLSWRQIFVPTGVDLQAYASFAGRLAHDGRRLFQGTR
jgi:O-antigen/teichoic acid export membrane protein